MSLFHISGKSVEGTPFEITGTARFYRAASGGLMDQRTGATRLLDQVREQIRYTHYSLRTGQAYVQGGACSIDNTVCSIH